MRVWACPIGISSITAVRASARRGRLGRISLCCQPLPLAAAPGREQRRYRGLIADPWFHISGDRDAILVDALLTTSEGKRLAAWVQTTGKRPRAIFVTHGHADHFFGAGPVLDAYPGAQLMACDQQVVDEARGQTTPKAMASWNSRFAGQLSQSPAVPALTSSKEFDLEGHPLLFRTIGGADGVLQWRVGQVARAMVK